MMAVDLATLKAVLTLDTTEFTKNAEEVEGKASSLAGNLGNILGGTAAAIGASVAAASAAVVGLVKDAVSSYANYEQLVGGVETLFKESAGIVEDYAMQAYKTAGISANEYMEQATAFSASLLQSLQGDTEQAAHVTDMAITDMADNANKMGTALSSIQTAYQGFAKQNYTMLDNLKLGYGGTKQEMERLLADAEKLSGIKYDISNLNDVFQAIHVIQVELGITGTTAKEAEQTISGSLGMLKASWADLITSIAGGGKGFEEALASMVESARIFAENLIPVVQEALYGVGDLVRGLAPVISEALPELVATVLPNLIDAALSLLEGVVSAFPQIVEALIDALPTIVSQIMIVVSDMIGLILTQGIPLLVELAIVLVETVAQGIAQNLDALIPAVVQMIMAVTEIVAINLPKIIQAGLDIIMALVDGLLNNMDLVLAAIIQLMVEIPMAVVASLPEIIEAGAKIVWALIKGILMIVPNFIKAVGKLLGIVKDTKYDISEETGEINETLSKSAEHADNIASLIDNSISSTARAASNSTSSIAKSVKDSSVKVYDAAGNIIGSMKNMADGSTEYVRNGVKTIFDETGKALKDVDDKTESIRSASSLAEASVSESMDSVSSSVTSAAIDVADACASINSSISSISGLSVNIGARASGGPVSVGSPYIVGEEGPELYVPQSNGYILNAEETASLFQGRRGDIYITIQGDVYDDERSMKKKMKVAVLDVLQEQMAYG